MDRHDPFSRSSSIRFQLSLYTRCITRMGCGSHRMFPWLLPIHIQDCLHRNGSIDTVCYPQFLGLLTFKAMKRSCHRLTSYKQSYCNMGCGSCPSRTALFVGGRFKYEDKNEERDRENTSHWQADELQGKVGQCFLSDSKVGPQVVSEKIILAVLRYFPRKPCLTGSISLNALVVQRTAKVRVLTI